MSTVMLIEPWISLHPIRFPDLRLQVFPVTPSISSDYPRLEGQCLQLHNGSRIHTYYFSLFHYWISVHICVHTGGLSIKVSTVKAATIT